VPKTLKNHKMWIFFHSEATKCSNLPRHHQAVRHPFSKGHGKRDDRVVFRDIRRVGWYPINPRFQGLEKDVGSSL
jgi:hypothetical protein